MAPSSKCFAVIDVCYKIVASEKELSNIVMRLGVEGYLTPLAKISRTSAVLSHVVLP